MWVSQEKPTLQLSLARHANPSLHNHTHRHRTARVGILLHPPPTSLVDPVSRTSYWSPLVTTRSPLSLARTSRHAITRLARPRGRPIGARWSGRRRCCESQSTPSQRHLKLADLPTALGKHAAVAHQPQVLLTQPAPPSPPLTAGCCSLRRSRCRKLGVQEAAQDVQPRGAALLRVELRAGWQGGCGECGDMRWRLTTVDAHGLILHEVSQAIEPRVCHLNQCSWHGGR